LVAVDLVIFSKFQKAVLQRPHLPNNYFKHIYAT